MPKPSRIHTVNVQLSNKDKRLLERLAEHERLPRTEVVRRLIRQAHDALGKPVEQLRSVANG